MRRYSNVSFCLVQEKLFTKNHTAGFFQFVFFFRKKTHKEKIWFFCCLIVKNSKYEMINNNYYIECKLTILHLVCSLCRKGAKLIQHSISCFDSSVGCSQFTIVSHAYTCTKHTLIGHFFK